jgi:large subunit ribosomal protein L3
VTIENLEIVQVDEPRNLILVKGAVPGVDNAVVRIVDAHKRARPAEAPYPAVMNVEAAAEVAAPAAAEAKAE